MSFDAKLASHGKKPAEIESSQYVYHWLHTNNETKQLIQTKNNGKFLSLGMDL